MRTRNTHSLLPVYPRADIAFTHGEGAYLFADNGDRYLDFVSGIAVNALGHAHPDLIATLRAQAEKLWHVSNLFRIHEQEALADRLVEKSFADRIFFSNSGTEAIECAIKMARAHHDKNGNPERTEIITFEGAFHGRTLAALAASGKTQGFGAPLAGFTQIGLGDEAAFNAAIGAQTAAVLIEPIQGDSGVRIVDEVFLDLLRKSCDQHGALLIFDEVQIGMGRTGSLFAYEPLGWSPDIMVLAKGLGAGFPIGACLATEAAAAGMTHGMHGSTFGGNPLAMAVALKVLEIVSQPEFLSHVRRIGLSLTQRLSILGAMFPDIIQEWRGRGLIHGFTCPKGAQALVAEARAQKLLLAPAYNETVRLLPPLNITEAHLTEAAERLEAACAALSTTPKGALVDALDKAPPLAVDME